MEDLSRQQHLQAGEKDDKDIAFRILQLVSDGGIELLDEHKEMMRQHGALPKNKPEASAEAKDDYQEKSSLSLLEADQDKDEFQENLPFISGRISSGKSQLHFSAENGDTELVELLIKAGNNVDAKDKNKRTPLHLNARSGHQDIVEILLKAGADVDAKDKNKQTPLHLSAKNGHKNIVEILLKAGARVDAENIYKERPLHLSFKNNHKDVAEVLIRAGASDNKRDIHGYCVRNNTDTRGRVKYRMATSTILPSIRKLVHSVTTNVKSTLSPASISTETELRETVSATFNAFESKFILCDDSTFENVVTPTDPKPSCAPPEESNSGDIDDSGEIDVLRIRQQLMDHISKFCLEESEEGFSPELRAALLAGKIVMPVTINITTISKEIQVYNFQLVPEFDFSQPGVITVNSHVGEGRFVTDDEEDDSSCEEGK